MFPEIASFLVRAGSILRKTPCVPDILHDQDKTNNVLWQKAHVTALIRRLDFCQIRWFVRLGFAVSRARHRQYADCFRKTTKQIAALEALERDLLNQARREVCSAVGLWPQRGAFAKRRPSGHPQLG